MSSRRALLPLCMLLPLVWSSCGDGGRGVSYAGSYRDKAGTTPGVPALGPSADLVVRPDLMAVSFSFWRTAASTDGMLPTLKATVGLPSVMVKDPEAHRAELMKRWVDQSRAFAVAVQGERPLQLTGCALPGAVEQQVVTLEEVVLKLAMNCQLEAPAAAR